MNERERRLRRGNDPWAQRDVPDEGRGVPGYGTQGFGTPGTYGQSFYGQEERIGGPGAYEIGQSRPEPGPHRGRGPKGYQRADERIHEDICERLTQHGHIDASEVEVTVQNGEVTLNGSVPDRQQKRLVEDTVEEVLGVKDVHNRLRVAKGGQEQSRSNATIRV